jgi:hypothetical protein
MAKLQGFSNRLRAVFSALTHGSEVNAGTAKGITDPGFVDWLSKRFTQSYERTQVHKDMGRMDKDDDIVTFALDAIASRALGYEDPTIDGFTLLLEPTETGNQTTAKKAQSLVNDLIKRCDLRQEGWQILRRAVKYGNEFRSIGIDWTRPGIAVIKQLPEHTIWPNIDQQGNRVPGYEQATDWTGGTVPVVKFDEWEVVHFHFGELDGYLGTPLLGSARRNWKRLNLAEDMTAVARLVRAFVKNVHHVPVNKDWDPVRQQRALQDYKDAMTKRNVFGQDTGGLEREPWPQTVYTDFYIPDDGTSRGGVDMLDPTNTQLTNLRDIEHFRDRLITATRVPKRYFPFEGGAPKLSEGGGQSEDKHFACLLMICQMMLKTGYERVFNLELILNGIDPAQVRYVWRMARINTTDALRGAQTDLSKARTFEALVGKYPEILEYPDIVFREWTTVSDVSAERLGKIKPPEPAAAPPPISGGGNGKGGPPATIQLPGTGVGPEVRSKV